MFRRLLTVLLFSALSAAALSAGAAKDPPEPGKQTHCTVRGPAGQPYRSPEEADRPGDDVAVESEETVELHYWLYLPVDESARSPKGFPVLFLLHGAGGGDDVEALAGFAFPGSLGPDACKTWPFITVTPACPAGSRWSAEQLLPILDRVLAETPADPDRVYVMGVSMGGYGTWMMLVKAHDRIAAGIPLCGGCDPAEARRLADMPIWAFHGEEDTVVLPRRSIEIVRAIKENGGEKVRLTLYPGCGHDCWSPTCRNPEIYSWLLDQSLEKRRNAEP